MRVLWLSANRFGFTLLQEAMKIEGIDVIGIVTLSDTATTVMYDGVDKNAWHSFGIPVYSIVNINREASLLRSLAPDLIIMCGWRQIVGSNLLEIPARGFVGFHPTLLPKGRGPAPLINTILEGYTVSGLTFYYVDEHLDSGDVIGQEEFTVSEKDHADDLYNKIEEAGKILVKKYLPQLAAGTAPRIRQNESQATVFPARTLADNEIDLAQDTPEVICRKIRAFSHPYRGAFIRFGNKKLKLWRAELEETDE